MHNFPPISSSLTSSSGSRHDGEGVSEYDDVDDLYHDLCALLGSDVAEPSDSAMQSTSLLSTEYSYDSAMQSTSLPTTEYSYDSAVQSTSSQDNTLEPAPLFQSGFTIKGRGKFSTVTRKDVSDCVRGHLKKKFDNISSSCVPMVVEPDPAAAVTQPTVTISVAGCSDSSPAAGLTKPTVTIFVVGCSNSSPAAVLTQPTATISVSACSDSSPAEVLTQPITTITQPPTTTIYVAACDDNGYVALVKRRKKAHHTEGCLSNNLAVRRRIRVSRSFFVYSELCGFCIIKRVNFRLQGLWSQVCSEISDFVKNKVSDFIIDNMQDVNQAFSNFDDVLIESLVSSWSTYSESVISTKVREIIRDIDLLDLDKNSVRTISDYEVDSVVSRIIEKASIVHIDRSTENVLLMLNNLSEDMFGSSS